MPSHHSHSPLVSLKDNKVRSIADALNILDDAARDSAEDIREMINQDYKRLRQALGVVRKEAQGAGEEMLAMSEESLDRIRDRVVKGAASAAKAVESTVHENPWYLLGAVAAIAATAGFFIARRD